ncbi:hypothetical protein D1P53_002496 [Cryptococcus gattii VGV]|nr:hypothetical protein D1P53_002496 [Cryptococcus gattii VGV]
MGADGAPVANNKIVSLENELDAGRRKIQGLIIESHRKDRELSCLRDDLEKMKRKNPLNGIAQAGEKIAESSHPKRTFSAPMNGSTPIHRSTERFTVTPHLRHNQMPFRSQSSGPYSPIVPSLSSQTGVGTSSNGVSASGSAERSLRAAGMATMPFVGKRLFSRAIGWTKDGYGRLLITITVLFGPTQFAITTDTPPSQGQSLVERDVNGQVVKINLPDRLVIMANHQAYLDWIYIWILACYAGHSPGLIILLKASLKNIPVVGWGMRFFNFIFLRRSWASDRNNLTLALRQLGKEAQSGQENSETSRLLPLRKRSPLWLLIFPEGTIVSDEERIKSIKYAKREGIVSWSSHATVSRKADIWKDDFATLLHPRSTGLLFCLRTLLPQIPDLNLLDITIGYPGVPFGKYAQNW